MNKDINNLQKLYEATQEQSITVTKSSEIPKGYTGHVKFTDGVQYWYKNGKKHRDDGPAAIFPDGTQEWFKNGKHHREDGPAIIGADGSQSWYKKGKVHRDDGPAVINPNGHQEWWIDNNQYSKEEFDAIHNKYTGYIKFANGTQKWFKNGQWHREDGPAVIGVYGEQFWYKNGKVHREDGPAIIWPNGEQQWYLDDKNYTREDYYRELHKRGKISDGELFAELL